MLTQFVFMVFAILGVLSLIVDVGLLRVTQAQMQPAADAAAYASGVLIGNDVGARDVAGRAVHLLATGALAELYAVAIETRAGRVVPVDATAAFVAGILAPAGSPLSGVAQAGPPLLVGVLSLAGGLRLPRLVAPPQALEMMLTGRALDARRARRALDRSRRRSCGTLRSGRGLNRCV